MADPTEELLRSMQAEAEAINASAMQAYRDALERARGAWANGWQKGIEGLREPPAAPG